MNQEPPSLIGEGDAILSCLTLRTVKINIDFSLRTRFMLFPKRKRYDIGDIVVVKEPAVHSTDRATSHKDDRQPK